MIRARLTDLQMDSAFSLFRVELSLATCLHEPRYLAWLKAHQRQLIIDFMVSDEPSPDECQVEATFGIWARRRFLEHRNSQVSA